jgi:hypothetical protein
VALDYSAGATAQKNTDGHYRERCRTLGSPKGVVSVEGPEYVRVEL